MHNITKAVWVRHLLMAWVLITLAAPSFAFRMIQNDVTGRVTAGFLVSCRDPGGFAHWNTRDITWHRNVGALRENPELALRSARLAWSFPSNFNLMDGGTTRAGFATDGINTTIWEDNDACSNECLALTALVLGPDQEILESDVTFRATGVRWRALGEVGDGEVDVQAVATHEFGHSLGIHHTEVNVNPLPTMWWNYNDVRVGGRTLEQDDLDALDCIDQRYFVCTQSPGTPGPIAGPAHGHCLGDTELYFTNPAEQAETYRWQVVGIPWEQVTTFSGTQLTADFGIGSFPFRVRAENQCGVSPWRNATLFIQEGGGGFELCF